MYFILRFWHRKGVIHKCSSAQVIIRPGKYNFMSLFTPSEHDLHSVLFHFAIRIRWANFEREDCKNIEELYAWSTKEAELIGMCILYTDRDTAQWMWKRSYYKEISCHKYKHLPLWMLELGNQILLLSNRYSWNWPWHDRV